MWNSFSKSGIKVRLVDVLFPTKDEKILDVDEKITN